jgi:hypothetical protein
MDKQGISFDILPQALHGFQHYFQKEEKNAKPG